MTKRSRECLLARILLLVLPVVANQDFSTESPSFVPTNIYRKDSGIQLEAQANRSPSRTIGDPTPAPTKPPTPTVDSGTLSPSASYQPTGSPVQPSSKSATPSPILSYSAVPAKGPTEPPVSAPPMETPTDLPSASPSSINLTTQAPTTPAPITSSPTTSPPTTTPPTTLPPTTVTPTTGMPSATPSASPTTTSPTGSSSTMPTENLIAATNEWKTAEPSTSPPSSSPTGSPVVGKSSSSSSILPTLDPFGVDAEIIPATVGVDSAVLHTCRRAIPNAYSQQYIQVIQYTYNLIVQADTNATAVVRYGETLIGAAVAHILCKTTAESTNDDGSPLVFYLDQINSKLTDTVVGTCQASGTDARTVCVVVDGSFIASTFVKSRRLRKTGDFETTPRDLTASTSDIVDATLKSIFKSVMPGILLKLAVYQPQDGSDLTFLNSKAEDDETSGAFSSSDLNTGPIAGIFGGAAACLIVLAIAVVYRGSRGRRGGKKGRGEGSKVEETSNSSGAEALKTAEACSDDSEKPRAQQGRPSKRFCSSMSSVDSYYTTGRLGVTGTIKEIAGISENDGLSFLGLGMVSLPSYADDMAGSDLSNIDEHERTGDISVSEDPPGKWSGPKEDGESEDDDTLLRGWNKSGQSRTSGDF
ncbi:hypothetical protein ACA910_002774 [Epithemia clementina (nom. ined.)]